jgi:5-methylcytosine-specific restriction protein A
LKLRTLAPRIQQAPDRLPTAGRPRKADGTPGGQGLYTYRWKQASKRFLREHPLCQCPDCDEGRKRLMVATVTDHRIPHRGDYSLFWDRSLWQAMAKECHDRKTAAEDGGFGNAPR